MRQVRHQIKAAATPGSIGSMPLDPNLHYVRVEKESQRSDYVAPIEEMLHQGYNIVSEDRAVTGHSKVVLMAIEKSKFDARQRDHEEEALASASRPSPHQEAGTWESTEIGSAMTIQQLSASVKGAKEA
jgi:hypothetical protein